MKRTLFQEFVLFVRVLLTPSIWVQFNRYSSAWDEKLQSLMVDNKFHDIDRGRYTVKLGDEEVWIANHPYASFTPYKWAVEVRPSRRTIIAAWDKLCRDAFDE